LRVATATDQARRCLVIVTRAPGAGPSKTRLAAGVGAGAVLRLQRAFMHDTLSWAADLAEIRVLSVHPPTAAPALAGEAPGCTVVAQTESDFGARMRGAVNAGFAAGGTPVAMIATDSPSLPAALVEAAFTPVGGTSAAGAEADVALGPAEDGGWVLIATRAPLPDTCFDGVRWSSPQTLTDTVAGLERCGLRVGRTEPWYDVDERVDLDRLASDARDGSGSRLARTRAELGRLGIG